jgi:hypothetical protein
MRDDLTVKVELEAEDTLAVRLKSLHMEGPGARGSVRETLERQTHGVLSVASCFDGGLALLEVDGVSSAVLIRTPKPTEGRFVEVVLRNGNSIQVEARGAATHLSRENYEKVLEKFEGLL